MHAEAVAGIVDRIVTRYRRDPTCMVQILREVQEACDWIPPEAIDRMQVLLGVSPDSIPSSIPSRAANTASCSRITLRIACSATRR
jgi:NADH:ubiquinone oxidoreductase subunit E